MGNSEQACMRNRVPWSLEENLIVFNLYCKLPFGKMHHRNPEVVKMAQLLGRTANSIAMRLGNFASMDPNLQERGIKGLGSSSKGVTQVWEAFREDPERVTFEGEALLASRLQRSVEAVSEIAVEDLPEVGREREAMLRTRVNQSVFRKRILAVYEYRCCITGIDVPELLVASHIVPWSVDRKNRLNPRNGLCLNPLHDRAFDRGLIWIDSEHIVRSSDALVKRCDDTKAYRDWLLRYDGCPLRLPRRFKPDSQLLAWHQEHVGLRSNA